MAIVEMSATLVGEADAEQLDGPTAKYVAASVMNSTSDQVANSKALYSAGPIILEGVSTSEVDELNLVLGPEADLDGASDLQVNVIADYKVGLPMPGSGAMSGNAMTAMVTTIELSGSSELGLLGEADLFAVVASSGNSALTVDVTKVEVTNTSRGPQVRPTFVPPPVIPTIRVVPAAAPPPSYMIPTNRPRRREDR